MTEDKQKLSTESYKGVRDFYPKEWGKLQALFDTARGVLTAHGYEEYNASPLEPSELYESKGNEEIIRDQTFTFTDRGERKVTLRPEMTPTLARMVAGKRRELPFPLRWFSIGNRFRYERPQHGRLREFYQIDVDFVGLPEGEADVEVISIAYRMLTAYGAKSSDFSIRINSRRLLTLACKASGLPEGDAARAYWQLIDRKGKMKPEDFAAARKEFSADPLAVIEAGTDAEVEAEKQRIAAFIETLHARGIDNAVFDLDIVRGFDYYTGMVFEVVDTDPVNARSLFGGGRYDGLVTLFGGDPIPAVGFATSDVSLANFLEAHGYDVPAHAGADIYVATPTPEDTDAARIFAYELRTGGARVFLNLAANKSLGDQVKDALRREIPYFIAFGKDEAASGIVKLKTLASSTEESLSQSDVASRIRSAS
jgi:histidyl-tRNA synthetase